MLAFTAMNPVAFSTCQILLLFQCSTKTLCGCGGGAIPGPIAISTSHFVAGAMEQRWGMRETFEGRKWMEMTSWSTGHEGGICHVAKDIMCRLKRYLQTIKIQLSCDILYSHDNEELIENDNCLIICELWIMCKLVWKLEVCHDMTFLPRVAPVCDDCHDDFNQPGYPVESKIIPEGSMLISLMSELMDCWKCQFCGRHM